MTNQISRDGRTWKEHFPEGDLWVFGYGQVYQRHQALHTS